MVQQNVPLSAYTSYRIGGPARFFTEPQNENELQQSLALGRRLGLQTYILGRGTNLLVSDRGVNGLVIHIGKNLSRWYWSEDDVWVEAGMSLHDLIYCLAQEGWGGFQLLAGIPGSVGGAITMNAGAHRVFIGDFVREVRFMSSRGEVQRLFPEDLGFGYRTSSLQEKTGIVLATRLRVERPEREQLQSEMEYALKRRQAHPPLPSCGSVFRNPPGLPAGQLIEELGLKGRRQGQAQIALEHGNFIVNLGGARARDVYGLIRLAQEEASKKGFELHTEVRLWGDFTEI